jgi:hypothetical protein
VIVNDLTGSSRVQPMGIGAARDAYAVNATEVLQGYVAQVHDELQIVATLTDQQQRKTVRVFRVSGKMGGDVLPVIESMVHEISGDARPFPTRKEAAVKEYFLGMAAGDARERAKRLELAIQADPQFGTAYVSYVQALGVERRFECRPGRSEFRAGEIVLFHADRPCPSERVSRRREQRCVRATAGIDRAGPIAAG